MPLLSREMTPIRLYSCVTLGPEIDRRPMSGSRFSTSCNVIDKTRLLVGVLIDWENCYRRGDVWTTLLLRLGNLSLPYT